MYSLDINFLKERAAEGQPQAAAARRVAAAGATPADWLPAIGGAIVGAALVAGVLFYGRLIDGEVEELEAEVATLQGELRNLQANEQQIQQKRQELNERQNLTRSLANIFDRIRPMTAILQDVSDRLPEGVQLEAFQQTGERPDMQVQLQGIASSYSAITAFALAVEQSEFIERGTLRLSDIRETEYPLNDTGDLPEEIEPVPVFGYTLVATLSDTSAASLLDELRRKGADGLATRIAALEAAGLIPEVPSEGIVEEGGEPAEPTEPQ